MKCDPSGFISIVMYVFPTESVWQDEGCVVQSIASQNRGNTLVWYDVFVQQSFIFLSY
jgi:hypothetical protein